MFITVIQKKTDEFILSRFQARRGSLIFLKGARHQLDDPETSVEEILATWADECRSDRTVLALPPDLLSLREIDLPISDRKKGRELLPLELKGEMATEVEMRFSAEIPIVTLAFGLAISMSAAPAQAEPKADVAAATLAWAEAVVKPGERVAKKQLLARGTTHIYFQANVWPVRRS